MNDTLHTHPSREQLLLFGQGRLPDAELGEIADHVSRCDVCCQTLEKPNDDTLENLARHATVRTEAPAGEIPPQLIDHPRYHVRSLLGVGGMGMVFRAEHRIMGREIALKVMSPGLLSNAAAVERFRREVRAAAKLNHPNIVTAHDADESRGLHFLVMEYVEGVNFDRYVARKGPLAPATACHFIRQAALGLAHAHQHGMIHRDIKPQNLMVTRKGQVKILDFGLARLARREEDDNETDRPTLVTAASTTLGTPDYLSPEQARNARDIDTRSDLYSLGCTFYFLLTGRVPFPKATTVIDKLLAHTQQPATPIRAIRPEISGELDALVSRMMAKNPADRFMSATEVAAALLSMTRNNEPTVPLPELPNSPADSPVTQPELIADPKPSPPESVPVPKRRRKKKPRRPVPLFLIAVGAALVTLLMVSGAFYAGLIGEGRRPGAPANNGGESSTNGRGAVTATAARGKRVLYVLPAEGLWNDDYLPVRVRLEQSGCVVTTTSTSRVARQVRDQKNSGPDVTVDLLFADVTANDFDAIVFAGYKVSQYAIEHKTRTVALIDSFQSSGKIVSAICGGQQVLARLGYLDGHSAARSEIGSEGNYYRPIKWLNQPAVTDGRLITGSSGNDPLPFADALARALSGK